MPDYDNKDVEEARPMTNLESIMASLRTLATLVTDLQYQEGLQGCTRQQE